MDCSAQEMILNPLEAILNSQLLGVVIGALITGIFMIIAGKFTKKHEEKMFEKKISYEKSFDCLRDKRNSFNILLRVIELKGSDYNKIEDIRCVLAELSVAHTVSSPITRAIIDIYYDTSEKIMDENYSDKNFRYLIFLKKLKSHLKMAIHDELNESSELSNNDVDALRAELNKIKKTKTLKSKRCASSLSPN
jgi:hypothetical protein